MTDKYGGLKKVTATRWSIHKYLGMIVDFSTKGKVKFRMDNYVEEMLDEFPKIFGSNDIAQTPASSSLFESNNSKLLDNHKRELYHTYVAKCLFYQNVLGRIYN